MLQRLSIKNYAIIENLEMKFSDKLTIITGETGAGKSILLGALSLILGERAESNVLFDKEQKCFVEGSFEVHNYHLQNFFKENELDYEEQTIIRREITPNGKSRAFINDTPVNLEVLRELCSQLVDLHSQHEMLELNTAIFQMKVIDSFAKNEKLLSDYQTKFKIYQAHLFQLENLREQNNKATAELDYLQFQFNELSEANFQQNEQEQLEQELATLTNAEEIKKALISAINILNENENSVNTQLREINSSLNSVKKFNPMLAALCERLQSSVIELSDVVKEFEKLESSTIYDETRINEITERVDLIYRLEKKHNVQTTTELMEIRNNLEKKISSITNLSEEIEQLQKQISEEKNELMKVAVKISENRKKTICPFEKQANSLLKEVGMPFAQLKVKQEIQNELNQFGIDKILFLFSSNKGTDFQEIKKVASGGELSRLLLCIKSLVANSTALPSLIFDEIDTGVSGEVAFKVGNILEELSQAHQVISITHLPQIARKGEFHYLVFKQAEEKRTATKVKLLNEKERVVEIAKMIGGEKPSDAALKSARELIEN